MVMRRSVGLVNKKTMLFVYNRTVEVLNIKSLGEFEIHYLPSSLTIFPVQELKHTDKTLLSLGSKFVLCVNSRAALNKVVEYEAMMEWFVFDTIVWLVQS